MPLKSRSIAVALAGAAIMAASIGGATAAPVFAPKYQPPYGGFYVNRYGQGLYSRGQNGSFGGYPAGSPQAEELEQNQHDLCKFAPERCF